MSTAHALQSTGTTFEPPGRASAFLAEVAEQRLRQVFATAGIRPNGGESWDPQIRHNRAYLRLALEGTRGAGESYVDGDWDCDALDELAARVTRMGVFERLGSAWRARTNELVAKLVNRQTPQRAQRNGVAHYDRGNAFYEAMLGPSMVYSCGYWRDAKTLDEAQRAKLERIGEKIQLRRGQRVLDIGCGWGAFAQYAAEQGARVVGITVSPSQASYARARCRGLPVDILIADYRDLKGDFDRVVSIGMFEHVGPRNYRDYMQCAHRFLADGGLFLLHTIGTVSTSQAIEPWIDRHIFPGAVLPAAAQIAAAADGLFVVEDVENFGADYDRTLRAWWQNLESTWPSLGASCDSRFRRLWRYYLLTCAGAFRARRTQLWQFVLSKGGVPGGYTRP